MEADELQMARRPFTAITAHILKSIPDTDCRLMGICPQNTRPENAILLVMPVCPPVTRPSTAAVSTHLRGQDDVTQMLQSINKRAHAVREACAKHNWYWDRDVDMPMPEEVADAAFKLQTDISIYYDQSHSTVRYASSRHTATIKERLSHKEGRLRGNLMGKRTNFSARTVISPDPFIDVEEVGVPISIATSMTVAERVNAHNMARLHKAVSIGAHKLGGAQSVITPKGIFQLSTDGARPAPRLQKDDIVERYIRNGDRALFNRQPSLHSHSMSAHVIRVMHGSTFRLNLAPTSAYNADFDGDEMNLHVPQSVSAHSEMQGLMLARRHLVGAKANKPVMGVVQDSLLGAHLLTAADTRLSRSEVGSILYRVHHPLPGKLLPPDPDGVADGEPYWNGTSVFSCLLPADFYLRRGGLHIERGCVISGQMDKSTLGMAHGGVLQTMVQDYGSDVAINFLSDVQRVAIQYITLRGFGVGISDCVLSSQGDQLVRKRIDDAIEHIEAISRAVDACPDVLTSREIENGMSRVLGQVLLQTGGIVEQDIDPSNRIRQMGKAGSKGNAVNLSQILGAVGQNTVGGARIGLGDTCRLSCHGDGPEWSTIGKHGFVANSYMLGLTPVECFHHARGGREGLVDTAVKTATTGYFQRRCVKAVENFVTTYTGAVVSGEGAVLQYAYGGDGQDAAHLEKVSIQPLLQLTKAEMRKRMVRNRADAVGKSECETLCTLLKRVIRRQQSVLRPTLDANAHVPMDPGRVFARACYMNGGARLTSKRIQQEVNELCSRIRAATVHPMTLLVYETLIRWHFGSHCVMPHMSSQGFEWALGFLFEAVQRAVVSPGEAVGILAAQSVGELTQLTLNTFHLAGVCSVNQTLGIPRFKELVDLTRNSRTPVMQITLAAHIPYEEAERIAHGYVQLTLHDVMCSMRTLDELDDEWALFVDLNQTFHPHSWGRPCQMAEIGLHRAALAERQLTPGDLCTRLDRLWTDDGTLAGRVRFVPCDSQRPQWAILMCVYEHKHEGAKGAKGVKGAEGAKGAEEPPCVPSLVDAIGDIENTVLFGIQGISACAIERANEQARPGTIAHETLEPPGVVITTAGSCLEQALSLPDIDPERTYSNDPHEIYELYGVEAAAHVLYHEFVRTLSYDGNYVNYRHILLLVDFMTHNGTLVPLSRFGINRLKRGVLQRCSFEEVTDMLENAGFFGETDAMNGVSQSVITGAKVSLALGTIAVWIPIGWYQGINERLVSTFRPKNPKLDRVG